MRARQHKLTTAAMRFLGWALLASGLALVLAQKRETYALEALSDNVRLQQSESTHQGLGIGIGSGFDWESLKAINPDVAAWVQVDGTDIDLPVMAPSDEDMSYYLQHDLWGNRAIEGVPFLDHRCLADGVHRLAYGHRLFLGGQFSALQKAYRQEVFEQIGACRWSTPTSGTTSLLPYCALYCDAWFAGIQCFDLQGEGLEAWLLGLAADAEATSAHCETLARRARSAVTLVTCSSELSGQPWRTVVVFVEVSHD